MVCDAKRSTAILCVIRKKQNYRILEPSFIFSMKTALKCLYEWEKQYM